MSRTSTSTIKSTTPMKAIRAYCLDCTGGDKAEVRTCSFTECSLYLYRMNKRPPKGSAATPMKTIRENCLECCSGNSAEVRRCPADACVLHRYRTGRKVSQASEMSDVNAFLEVRVMDGIGKPGNAPDKPLFCEIRR